jgi:Flp pilus assembly protein TadD
MHQNRIAAQREERQQAIRRLESALRLQPRDGVTRAQLALLLRDTGMLQRAETEARLAVEAEPGNAYTNHVLGLVFAALGHLDLSGQALTNAARLAPGDGSIWNNLARTCSALGQTASAIVAFRKAVECSPDNPLFHSNLAGALVESGQHDESVSHYQKAIQLSPGDAESWNHLGQVYDELGKAVEAENCFRKALECDPEFSLTFVHLLMHHEDSVTEADLAACKALLESGKLNGKDEANLLLALAQMEDRRGAFQKAAELLQQANRVKNEWSQSTAEPYDPDELERLVDRVLETFTAGFLRERADWGIATDIPLFIFGLPRSGTTLTEQFLAAHPMVHGAGELRLGPESFWSVRQFAEDKTAIGDSLQELSAVDIQTIARQYLAQLTQLSPAAARIVDKMPENYLYAGWLALLFPNARFICCMRDFRDVALSTMITSFRYVQWSSNSEHLLHRFEQFRRLYDHWQDVLAGRMMTVHYHEMIEAPEATARRLVSWAGLPWDDACPDHRNSDARISTASLSQARKPIYTRSLGRWRYYAPYMSDLFAKVAQIDPVRHESDQAPAPGEDGAVLIAVTKE